MRNFTSFRLLVLFSLLASFGLLLSCDDDDAPIVFQGTVSGTITNANDSNERLQGVNVSLLSGSEIVKSTTTNAQGNFAIEQDVALEETFSIVASKDGFFDFVADAFTLTSGDQTEELDIRLEPLSKISGRVRNGESGEAIEEALVTIVDIDQNRTTNNLGEYEFDRLESGTYILSVAKSGFETYEEEVTVARSEFKNLDINLDPLPAELELSASSLDFGANEVSRTFQITNLGGDTIKWSVVENIAWVTANPSSGETTASESSSITLTVDRNGFNPGSYAQILTIATEESGSAEVNLTMTINGALLQIIPSELTFGTESVEESLQLERIGQGTLNYEIQADKSWITVEPSSGSIANETDFIIVKADRTDLGFGNYEAKIAFNTDNDSQIINATLTVPDPNAPQLTIDPLSLDLGQNVATRSILLQNTGKGSLNWSVSKSTAWLSVSESGGELIEGEAESIRVSVNRSSLTPGEYDDVLRFTSQGGNVNVPVTIEVANTPVLSISDEVLDFGRDAINDAFVISNIGNGTMTWSVGTNQDWIALNPLSGTNTGTVNVTVSRDGLSFGSYSGQIDVESDGGVGTVIVQMEFLPPNEPPVADFTISNQVVNLGQEVNLDASGSSDPEDALSLLEVRWRFQNSAAFTDWTSAKQTSVVYETQGIKEITLEVRDTDGGIASTSQEVNVIQNQPRNAVFSVNPSSGKINVTTFSVDATGSNDDIDEKADLQYRWRWEEGQSFTAWSREVTETHVYGSVGTKTITLEVLDSFGEIGSTSLNVELTEDLTEIEPNNLFSSANELAVQNVITGSVDFENDRVDWFRFVPSANGRVSVTISNTGGGSNSDLDQAILYDEGLNTLTLARISNFDARIEAGATRSTATATVSRGSIYFIRIAADALLDVTTYSLIVNYEEISELDTSEPNNASDEAATLVVNEFLNATVGFENDNIDWYEVIPQSNGQMNLTVENRQTGTVNGDLDQGILYDRDLTFLAAARVSNFDPRIESGATRISPTATVTAGRSYFVRIAPDLPQDASFYRVIANFTEITAVDSGEPNDASDVATSLSLNESANATVGFGEDDFDWYVVVPPSNGKMSVTVENLQTETLNGDLDQGILYDSELRFLAAARISNFDPRIEPGAIRTSSTVTVTAGSMYFIRIGEDTALDASFYRLRVNFEGVSADDIGEPNNSSDVASALNLNESSTATVGFGGDNVDWYLVTPQSDGLMSITVENLQTGTVNGELDQAILYDRELNSLAAARISNFDTRIEAGATRTSPVVNVVSGDTYFVRIAPEDGLDATFYRVQVNFEE